MPAMGGAGPATAVAVAVAEPRSADPTEPSQPADLPRPAERWLPVSLLEFAGCDSRRMTLAEYEALPDGRVEFFDSETCLAWMVREPGLVEHEAPVRTLAGLLRDIAHTRGSPIRCLGESRLRLVDADRGRERSIHPDEMVYLHPERRRRSGPGYLKVGEDDYPDVILEVDNTTDVRRNRLRLYEEWGFPEVWVEVPEAFSPGRPRGLKTGLRIYLREGERFGLSEQSRAFPGWRATEIHRALNEPVMSEETSQVLARVGRALGEREGTGPDDDPLLRSVGRQKQTEGRTAGRAGLVRAMLASRGIEVSADFPSPRHREALEAASDEAIVSAASAAGSEADFLARLGRS